MERVSLHEQLNKLAQSAARQNEKALEQALKVNEVPSSNAPEVVVIERTREGGK